MNLSMRGEVAEAYTSGSQRARVVTELWGENHLYCPNCPSPKLERLSHNTKASDYTCTRCGAWYQLKGQKKIIGRTINDGAYETMVQAIREDRTPNFYFMHYDLTTWTVRNLFMIPSFAFPLSAVVKRNALGPSARRAGWVGCNFALDRIAPEAKIAMVMSGCIIPPANVRAKYSLLKPLKQLKAAERGWSLDVLNLIRKIGKPNFTNNDVYAFERELEILHPNNRNIRPKIRQQLQVLRDMGLLSHAERGRWSIIV